MYHNVLLAHKRKSTRFEGKTLILIYMGIDLKISHDTPFGVIWLAMRTIACEASAVAPDISIVFPLGRAETASKQCWRQS